MVKKVKKENSNHYIRILTENLNYSDSFLVTLLDLTAFRSFYFRSGNF